MWLRPVVSTLLLALTLSTSASSQSIDSVSQNESSEQKLQNHFERDVYPLLCHPEKGCVDCHSDDGTSSLVLTGNSIDDFRLLLDGQYLKQKGVDSLLTRVTTKHSVKRMPKDAEPWSESDVQKLKSFLDSVQKTAEQNGSSADEQFSRSLLSQYHGTAPSLSENQFLTYWQLKGKIKVIFNDDWVRGDRDLFADNLSMLGGADFKTRFNESSQPSATFLTGLEMLARDVASHAYEQRTGPFRDWPTFANRPVVGQSIDSNYRKAIQQLYEQVLFRPATTKEIEEAYALLCEVFDEEESIKARDDELGFELIVKDAVTGHEQREMVRIPVSGDYLQVKQFLVDQTDGLHDLDPALSKSRRRKVLASNVRLEPETPNQRLILHNVGSIRNVSFAAIEILDSNGMVVESIGLDSPKIDVAGAWKIADEGGFKSYEDGNQSKGASSITISLKVAVAGEYQLVLLWRNNERNAKRVLAELYCKEAGNQLAVPELPKVLPLGEAHFSYDCSTDSEPFAEPKAVFQFSGDGEVEINNSGTLEAVTAGAIEFVNSQSADKLILIDSKDAVGNENWKRFADGRFKAYNTKGAKLHDDNEKKGELSLAYRLNSVTNEDWNPADYYRLRIYYPGKKDQECQVPVIVRASNSSPIIQVAFPSLAKADAMLRINASSSYTVSHSNLEFSWRQVLGTRVQLNDASSPVLEFVVHRRSVEQVAWTSLCSALLRHPDFVFTRPPSLMTCDLAEVKQQLRLVKLALDLVGRPPTTEETTDLAKGATLSELADRFLDSQEFRDFYFHRIRLNLESQGTETQDEPVRLWSYIAFNDRPFQEILIADYSVDCNMQKKDRPLEHGRTGVLTTPVNTENNVLKRLDNISDERYRVLEWGQDDHTIKTHGNIRYGYLAEPGKDLFPDLAILSSMHTGSGHSRDRLKVHMGDYSFKQSEEREEDERSVMQAFAEVYGQPYVLPNLSWHWWLSDGELNEVQYTGKRGYYHALGPVHAHTIYAGTPEKLRKLLLRMEETSGDEVAAKVDKFLQNAHTEILRDDNIAAVRSYQSARNIYLQLASRGRQLDRDDLQQLFKNPELRERFSVSPADELITYRSVNGNKARSKFSPNTNVQAMMSYEMMRSGLSCAFFIESRDVRRFDSHNNRNNLWRKDKPVGNKDQTDMMKADLWDPLHAFVDLLKNTEYHDTQTSLFNHTNIVLTSEFGRSIHGNVDGILAKSKSEAEKMSEIGGQDISAHWQVTSSAFLGGNVRGNAQFGRVGEATLMAIPILPDGSLDPNFDPLTGQLHPDHNRHPDSFIPNHGDVYSTALLLSGINPSKRGRNERSALPFIVRNT